MSAVVRLEKPTFTPTVFKLLFKMLYSEELDFVIVASPRSFHSSKKAFNSFNEPVNCGKVKVLKSLPHSS